MAGCIYHNSAIVILSYQVLRFREEDQRETKLGEACGSLGVNVETSVTCTSPMML